MTEASTQQIIDRIAHIRHVYGSADQDAALLEALLSRAKAAEAEVARLREAQTAPMELIQRAALTMLQNHDACMDGAPCDNGLDRHVTIAACFGAAAYEAAPCTDSGAHAMLRAFLLALIDPADPGLDYLRADPAAGEAARQAYHALRKGGAA